MPLAYKPKPGTKLYKKADLDKLDNAKRAIASGLSYRKAAKRFGIARTVLQYIDMLITQITKCKVCKLFLKLKLSDF